MPSPLPPVPAPPRRRDPVAKALRQMSGSGFHRSRPTRADLKRELQRQLQVPERGEVVAPLGFSMNSRLS